LDLEKRILVDRLKGGQDHEKDEDNRTVCTCDRACFLVRSLRREVGHKAVCNGETGDDRAEHDLPEDLDLSGSFGFPEDLDLSVGFGISEDLDLSVGFGFPEDLDVSGSFSFPEDLDVSGGMMTVRR
jgi:hypothetical protein